MTLWVRTYLHLHTSLLPCVMCHVFVHGKIFMWWALCGIIKFSFHAIMNMTKSFSPSLCVIRITQFPPSRFVKVRHMAPALPPHNYEQNAQELEQYSKTMRSPCLEFWNFTNFLLIFKNNFLAWKSKQKEDISRYLSLKFWVVEQIKSHGKFDANIDKFCLPLCIYGSF